MTDGELALKFIDENNLAGMFILWQEKFLDPQVFSGNVDVEAEDIIAIDVTNEGTSGNSIVNYGINN